MRRSVLLMLLLALILAGCGQPSVHSSDELQEDTHLAQQLFLADFSRNYEVLYVLTGDILEAAGDLSVVRKETELMENTSTRRFFSYPLCEIQNDFLPEGPQEALDAYYEAFWQYTDALACYTQEHSTLSPEMEQALQGLADFLPQQVPYVIKYECFDLDEAETGQAVSWLQDCTEHLRSVVRQAEAEDTASG